MRLKDVLKILYYDKSRKGLNRKATFTKKEQTVKGDWDPAEEKMPTYSKLLIFIFFLSFIFLIASILVATYIYYAGTDNTISAAKIQIITQGPAIVDGGSPATFTIRVANRNPVAIQGAELTIRYPRGSYTTSNDRSLREESIVLGKINQNEFKEHIITPVFLGEVQQQKNIDIALKYRLEGSVSLFESKSSHEVSLRSSPITTTSPTYTNPVVGRDVTLTYQITSNSPQNIRAAFVRAEYPIGFTPRSTFPRQVDPANAVWRADNLRPGETRTFQVTGILSGEQGVERAFSADILVSPTGSGADAVEVATAENILQVQRSFLSAKVNFRNVGTSKIVSSGQTVRGTIEWTNEDAQQLKNVQLILQLGGSGLDESKIDIRNGRYDGNTRRIIWDSVSNTDFEVVPVGRKGQVEFSLAALPNILDFNAENKTIDISVSAIAERVSVNRRDIVNAIDVTQLKVRSELQVQATTLYVTGDIKNFGPVPPTVGKKTSYTIQFFLKNNGNELRDITLQVPLTQDARFTGFTNNLRQQEYTYDEDTRLMTITIPSISAIGVNAGAHTFHTGSGRAIYIRCRS